MDDISKAAKIIYESKYCTAFTGAGISVESGIAPFRGKGGLYEKVSEQIFDLDYFYSNNKNCWYLLLKYILIPLLKAKPNDAHINLNKIEKSGYIKSIITQNIDSLHEKAGSNNIIKFHGTADKFKCIKCNKEYQFVDLFEDKVISEIENINFNENINEIITANFKEPRCNICGSIIKPQIVFFKEQIPENALNLSFFNAQSADCLLIIGTSGVVYPAAMIPKIVKKNNGKIIEINMEPSEYTHTISDIFIQSKASDAITKIAKALNS